MKVIEDLCLLACSTIDLCLFTVVMKGFAASIFRVQAMLMVFCALDLDSCSISVIFIFFQHMDYYELFWHL